MNKKDLLIEIGTEELPPKALKKLATCFADEIQSELTKKQLDHGPCRWFASPRRLAVIVEALASMQADKQVERRGPARAAAFAADGKPTRAAEGFARSCGVSVDELETLSNDKGEWLAYKALEKGQATVGLLQETITAALARLPIPKRMRWGSGDAEFVRPVHWAVVLFGEDSVACEIMGITSARSSYGHRFHHPQAIELLNAEEYTDKLANEGRVIVDYAQRQLQIREALEVCAESLGGTAIISPALLDEVTALVEWPVVISGSFDKQFLALPEEVLIASMQDHQKYFPLADSKGKLLPHFITVANIESKDPQAISKGNERVIYPRLSDASFFWQRDIARPLADYQEGLKDIVYQQQLGSLYEKSLRVSKLAANLAEDLGLETAAVERAAMLAKCDLSTSMVAEFPELQGVMGRHYALYSGEKAEIALAIDEQYKPRFAGDALPSHISGQLLAVAEKLDSLVGIFAIGQAPSGDKDPFALRRAAIGCLRIIIECELDLDLMVCLQNAARQYDAGLVNDELADNVFEFIMERLRRYYADNDVSNDQFEAVLALTPHKLLDFHHRIQAVKKFTAMAEAESLAAANKRIQNILKQSADIGELAIKPELLQDSAEKALASAVEKVKLLIQPLLENNDYQSILGKLAELREPVDLFFDEVMVMTEDEALKCNRLALLNQINILFLSTADISKLQVQQN